MSVIKVNNITNLDGTSGPVIAGITTVSSTSHFVVPTGNTGQRVGLAPDPFINNLVLALPFNSESVFDDISPRSKGTAGFGVSGIGTTTASLPFGQVGLSTNTNSGIVTHSKYYGYSLFLDGSANDFLRFNDSIDYEWSSEPFTWEVWIYFKSFGASYDSIFSRWGDGIQFQFLWQNSSSRWFLSLNSSVTGNTTVYFYDTIATDNWYHLSLQRIDQTTYILFKNGVKIDVDKTVNGNIVSSNIPFHIGVTLGGGNVPLFPLTGYLQDVRIYKGISKNPAVGIASGTQVFTPPTQIAL